MKIAKTIAVVLVFSWLASCNIAQDIIASGAPKADKLIGTYTVNRLEWGSLVFNYPGKNSFRNNASVPSAVMLSMQVKIEKYSDELVGLSAPSEFEFGGSPSFSTDPKTIKTLGLSYEAERTNLMDGNVVVGYVKNNILTLNYQKDNSQYLLTANKL